MAQIVTLDSGLAFFLALAFAAFVIAQRPDGRRPAARVDVGRRGRRWPARRCRRDRSGSCCPPARSSLYTVVTRDFAVWRRLHLVSGLALFLALTAPWFVAVSRANDEFLPLLLHPRAFRALPHRGAPARRRRGTTSFRSRRRQPAVARGARARGCRARGATARRTRLELLVAAVRARLGGIRVRVLQRLGLEAAVVHPADVRAARARARARCCCELPPPHALPARAAAAPSSLCALAVGVIRRLRPGRRTRLADGPQPVGDPRGLRPVAQGGDRRRGRRRQSPPRSRSGAPRRSPGARFWARPRSRCRCSPRSSSPSPDSRRSAQRARLRLSCARRRPRRPFAPDAPVYPVAMYDQTVPFYLGRTTTLVAIPRRARARHRRRARAARFRPSRRGSRSGDALGQGYAMMPPAEFEQLAADGVPMRVLARDARASS